ncbi:MAG: prepilin-type N-terminal cleavage/methylation domain-containing protein [Candidatus Methylomirabilales bacterium]
MLKDREAGCGIQDAGCPTSDIRHPTSNTGFTLLEVVVAIALLGIVLATALELLAVGLRSVKASGDSTQAVLLARRKLDELPLQELKPGAFNGASDGYRWTAEIVPEEQDTEDLPARLFTVRVKVFWAGRGGEKSLELVTLRGAVEEEKLPSVVFPALRGRERAEGGRRGAPPAAPLGRPSPGARRGR